MDEFTNEVRKIHKNKMKQDFFKLIIQTVAVTVVVTALYSLSS